MKITVTAGTGPSPGTTVLGDDADKAAPISEWLPKRSTEKQGAALLRSSAKKWFARGNRETSFSFVADRQMASYEEAVKFVRDHFKAVPNQGTVEVSQSGDHAFSCFLKEACIDLEVIRLDGVNVVMRYSVVGGEFQDAAPASTSVA